MKLRKVITKVDPSKIEMIIYKKVSKDSET